MSSSDFSMIIPEKLLTMIHAIASSGGTALIVGGAVRDSLLNLPLKDYDIEVFGIASLEHLTEILSPFGPLNIVGDSFGVLKHNSADLEVDFALPRTEKKVSEGHKGFTVETDGNLSFETAASRRDFTINSMGYNPLTQILLDPFNGQSDLKNKRILHVGPAFVEDPLRVFRAMQFAARFEFSVADETAQLCRTMPLEELPKERIFDEFSKLLLKAKRPSLGFDLMESLGLAPLYPELSALKDCPQDPEWHPEGDVWAHTMMVVDYMASLEAASKNKLVFMLAALCHDLGKPATTKKIKEKWTSYGHEQAGVPPTLRFLKKITNDRSILDGVTPLVEHHLKPLLLWKSDQVDGVGDAAIRRLSTKICIEDLLVLVEADHFGRTTPEALSGKFEIGDWLRARAESLNVAKEAPAPILLGRHLIELGFDPSPQMGRIIAAAYDLQIEGSITTLDEALIWAKNKLK
ncbi:HD domain-containing protein [bacterium]|jgi:tRNA nucleotidyltransferase (CCA-adding enzyme)|nr:HD domain-containing protein [bacterium]